MMFTAETFMKRKFTIIFTALLFVSIGVAATQTPAQQNNPFEDLLDSKREGMFAGGDVAYGSTRFSASVAKGELDEVEVDLTTVRSLSGGLQWRLGYATSERLAFYITSFATSLEPALGVLMYSEKYQGYYLNARVGYSSYGFAGELPVDDDEVRPNLSTWTLEAGVGYEFRPHFMIEGMAGYSRFTFADSYIYDTRKWESPFDSGEDLLYTDLHLNRITLFVSVNYLFY